jgi:hypothetical protein
MLVFVCSAPYFLSDFNGTWIFSGCFWKIFEYQISWKFVQWQPSCFIWTDRQTDWQIEMTRLLVAFRNFANKSQNPNHLILRRAKLAVCSEIHAKRLLGWDCRTQDFWMLNPVVQKMATRHSKFKGYVHGVIIEGLLCFLFKKSKPLWIKCYGHEIFQYFTSSLDPINI